MVSAADKAADADLLGEKDTEPVRFAKKAMVDLL
jgi:hypothetical protein